MQAYFPRPQVKPEGLHVSMRRRQNFRGHKVDTVYVCHEYSRMDMDDPHRATMIVEEIREAMIRQLAEQLYECLEFEDQDDHATMRVRMIGKINILREEASGSNG